MKPIHDSYLVLSMKQTMETLNVSRRQVYRLVEKGVLRRAYWPAAPKKVYFHTRDVHRLLITEYRDADQGVADVVHAMEQERPSPKEMDALPLVSGPFDNLF